MLGAADPFKAVGHEVRGGPPSQTLLLMYSGAWDRSQRRQWHPTPVLLPGKSHGWRSLVGCSPWGHEESDTTERLTFTFHIHALEKEMATHSSILAWRIPGMGEPGGPPSMGLHRVGHDWSNLTIAAGEESWQAISFSSMVNLRYLWDIQVCMFIRMSAL